MADDSEKTEEPTPKRRREAREKGQVLKSKEVNTAALVLISAYSLSWFGKGIYVNIFKLITQTIEEIPYTELTVALALKFFPRFIYVMIISVLPIVTCVVLTAVLVELLQVGILFTTKTLKPDLQKINPIKGFKKVFSMKSLVELVKGLVKTLIIGYIVYKTLKKHLHTIIGTIREPPESAFVLVGSLVLEIAKKVAAAMVIIAGIDYFYQRYEFEKSLKMSKQEVKDEYKQTEGDPLIKSKQRQKQRQIARGQVRQAVSQSDVVVSNPTHLAIALEYKPEKEMEAPIVRAKGENHTALLIKEMAVKFDVAIVEDKELARALYPVCVMDKEIPPAFYQVIAEIIAKIMKEKSQKALLELLRRQSKKGGITSSGNPSGGGNILGGQGGSQPGGGQSGSGPSSIFD